jgi:hypothetical protein
MCQKSQQSIHRHAELAEASLSLLFGLSNEVIEMLRQARHDGRFYDLQLKAAYSAAGSVAS